MNKVAKKDETKVSTNVINLEDDAGQGLEQIKSSDLKVPYMKLLQSSSDETKKGSEKYIPNAEPGDLYIESTGQMFKGEDGVKAVQVFYANTWNEWSTREAPAESKLPAPIVHTENIMHLTTKKGTKDILKSDQYRVIEDTGNHFCILLDNKYNQVGRAIIPMAISKKKVSKFWNTCIQNQKLEKADGSGSYTPATFGQIYNLGSKAEKSKAGDLYFNYSIEFDRIVNASSPKEVEIYQAGKKSNEDFENWDMASSNPEGSSVQLEDKSEKAIF
tara:strand:- start:488 stop:1309 length:822 start_codon:yes stop_codon:yes gene_type:complete